MYLSEPSRVEHNVLCNDQTREPCRGALRDRGVYSNFTFATGTNACVTDSRLARPRQPTYDTL